MIRLTLLFIGVWSIGFLLFTTAAASDLLFYRGAKLPDRIYRERVLAAFLWPFMLLSPNGRRRLHKALKGMTK